MYITFIGTVNVLPSSNFTNRNPLQLAELAVHS